jgi:tetratricopeptide (TPR) repeat protein
MIDFVHLDDILVMFPSGTARMQSAKVPQINIIAGNVPRHPVFNQRAPVYYRPNGNQERCMNKSAIRLLTLAMYAMALIAVPLTTAYAAGGDNPSPPASDTKDTKKVKKKKDKSSSIDDPKFLEGYRAAYATIYDRNDYSSAIEQLKALGQDDRADVANLIGYSYRKLGDYKVSQIWYERALKADPEHVRTWQYYGLWQVEQGNRDQAQYHLNRIAALTGTGSDEYHSLAAALEKPPGTGLVY